MDAFVTPAEAAVWRRLYDTGKLPMRVRMAIYVASPSDDSDEAVARLIAASKAGDVDPDFLRSGVVKVFADGVMEYPAQTAALLSPYLDADGKPTKTSGELYFDPQRFAKLVQKLDAAGLTVHVHAIGDRAVRASLDAFEAARAANGDKDNRHQIAHLQLVDPADFPRFKELGVLADFQLEWAKREPATEGPLEPYLGPERYRYLYPAGSLHKRRRNHHRRQRLGHLLIQPVPRLSDRRYARRWQGTKAAQYRGAYSASDGDRRLYHQCRLRHEAGPTTGSLEVGKRADLVVLDRDILTIDPETIQDTKVLATYLDGRLVHSAQPGSNAEDG